MKKNILFLFILISILCSNNIYAYDTTLTSNAKASILIEEKTGTILYENNKNERLSMASMTKVMTLCIIMDSIKDGSITYDSVLTTSEYAKSMGGSQVYLEVGETHTLDELIKCICISSANDAAVTVAESLYGSEEMFVNKMNEKALELNLSDTHFSDCTGLSNLNHYTSALNMALMSKYLLNNYPEILNYTSIKESYIREDSSNPFWLVNTNKLLGYNNIDGLKTGWTNTAGYCITATSSINNMRLIAVVMGYDNAKLRNKEVSELLNYGHRNYSLECLVKKGEVIDSIKDYRISPQNINIVSNSDIYIVKNNNSSLDNIKVKYTYNLDINNLLNNNNIGNVYLLNDDVIIDKCDIVLEDEIKRRNFFSLLFLIFKGIFS